MDDSIPIYSSIYNILCIKLESYIKHTKYDI